MGRVIAPWGVQGWVKVESYSAKRDTLCGFSAWLLQKDGVSRQVTVAECKVHGAHLVARFEGCEDRDQAAAYNGVEVAVGRNELPPLGPNEIYQSDLIGLDVRNVQGERLGRVAEIIEQPAHPVLRVVGGGKEHLLPLVPAVIRGFDLGSGVVEVDWGADW
jgi:16S rRNA processing protein RimM